MIDVRALSGRAPRLCWRESTQGRFQKTWWRLPLTDGLLQSDRPRVCGTPPENRQTEENAEADFLHLVRAQYLLSLFLLFLIIIQ